MRSGRISRCRHLGTIARAPICAVKCGTIKPQIGTSGAKICIVDDDTPVLRSLKELLASDDLDAETFDDPEKFLDYARDHVIRLAVLDLCMPTHSGMEVQEQLHHLSPETKVIIMTGHGEPGTRALALDGGAFAFLAKPLDDEAFLAAVRGALVE
jgi:FixJ family two-component response regulator